MMFVVLLLGGAFFTIASLVRLHQILNASRVALVRSELADLFDELESDFVGYGEFEQQMLQFLRTTSCSSGFMWGVVASLVKTIFVAPAMSRGVIETKMLSDHRLSKLMRLHRQSVSHEAPLAAAIFGIIVTLRFSHVVKNNDMPRSAASTAYGAVAGHSSLVA